MSMKKILRKERETFSIMTNMKEILGDFNALADARKKSSLLVKLAFGFCALTVSAVLFFSYSLLSSMGNKILVVNENGEYLKQKAMDTDKLYEELLRAHCSSTAYYLNSFDRLSWQGEPGACPVSGKQAGRNGHICKVSCGQGLWGCAGTGSGIPE